MKRICKKLLIFLFIFTTFIGGAFASSRLPNGDKPNERLMNELRGAFRFLDARYHTGKDIDKQEKARTLISSVLRNEKFHDHAVLALSDVEKECIDDYNIALEGTNQNHIKAMRRGIENIKVIRREFGL